MRKLHYIPQSRKKKLPGFTEKQQSESKRNGLTVICVSVSATSFVQIVMWEFSNNPMVVGWDCSQTLF